MGDVVRRCHRLVAPDGYARWVVVVVMALLVSGVEAASAVLVFTLLGMVTADGEALELPLLGDVRDLASGVDDGTLLAWTAAFIAGFFLLRGLLLVAKAYVEHRVTENAGAAMATRLLRGYLTLPYAWHVQRNSSELIRNAHESVNTIVRDALRPLVKVVSEGVLALGLLAVLVLASPLATALALLVLAPVVGVMFKIIQPRAKRLGQANQRLSKATLQSLQQGLQGLRDIKLLGREAFFTRTFSTDRRELARTRTWRGTYQAFPRAIIETVLVAFIAGFFVLTLTLEGGAAGAIPVLGVFAYAAFRLKQPIKDLTSAINTLRYAGPALEDVERDLDAARDAQEARAAEDADPDPLVVGEAITLEQVRYRYPGADEDALRDVSLTIPRGASIGIVGPTGGGKSTLVDVLVGLLEPTEGAVRVDGVDIAAHPRRWQRAIGMVPQSIFLVDDTIRGNIALGVRPEAIDEDAVARAVRMAQLDDVIARLPHGLDTVVGERGVRLSGGQRQRVAIARALYHDPSVLVLDEGTSALDNRTEASLLATIEALAGQRTLVTVAHRLTSVRACDRVVVVDGGTITAAGTYDELVASGAVLADPNPAAGPMA